MTFSKNEKTNEIIKNILGTGIYLLIILLITFLLIRFVGQRTKVSGSSMSPTLSDGDNLIVEKLSYRFGNPKRFDIIVFHPEREQKGVYYVKRIIGLPGETVQIGTDGTIYINGEVLNENYGKEVILSPGIAKDPITLGEDEYFVLGDNRNNSSDSRSAYVGNVKRSDIVGKAWIRIWPFSKFGKITHS